ncbi:Bis(5'nucleosyl)-tetraphosphatase, ApaH [Pseudidiomarina planktonica]|uniref:bis(5'-nucleosyl)-tetraphosphatase (symmetrical) n=1 Tax=Pseudidiomarina planktonica TaxID=1323738 RepID=A0A1Y6G3W4_9GAMM|nr:symmetrical bis(5'-nucleosyl)-tetraphosphatase [Pseudidiomarina planktonica]RUO63441.1 symmetrical bis(5'-nucleosyl)-tetraphosphatase [Pseudidiomarina planktonica]SMQ80316.1 Bis(5'nucleosyl)-tetraphosphatase, ApaH [Pseudidiomarina planktonica]
MAHYLVGDVHGCYQELETLLERVSFRPKRDKLFCVGDIVGRGPDSRKTLELFVSLGDSAQIVLGNHDLNLLALLQGLREPNPKDLLDGILQAPKPLRDSWSDWLRQQPLMVESPPKVKQHFTMCHAGIYPWWSLTEAASLADEVVTELKSDRFIPLLKNMYGNSPTHWHSSLSGFDRYRFIVNAFTRMRYCGQDGYLDLTAKGSPTKQREDDLKPWFHWWNPTSSTIMFGHWAALAGQTERADVIGLDTGCVWGEHLTLLSWPKQKYITAPAVKQVVNTSIK